MLKWEEGENLFSEEFIVSTMLGIFDAEDKGIERFLMA
jgi:hypothetical protein